MSYTVHQAKTNLSKLLKEAEEGKEVVITRGKHPVAKLVALPISSGRDISSDSKAPLNRPTEAPDPLTDDELNELGV